MPLVQKSLNRAKINDMKTVIKTFVAMLLLGLVTQADAQTNKGLQLDLSASPVLIHFGDDAYSTTFNMGVYYSISKSISFGFQFRKIYDFQESLKRYNASSSIGLGVDYVFFEGKDGTFWEGGSFEFLTDVGGGFSNFSDNEDFFYILTFLVVPTSAKNHT